MSWVVVLYDNFHYMDDDNPPVRHGEYATADEAIAEARRIVDAFLLDQRKDGMSAEELLKLFTTFADEPIVLPRDPEHAFSGYDYAKQRCAELCA